MSSGEAQDGFSLLEALAAVAVTAALLSGLALVAGQWTPQWRHGFLALQNADLIGLAVDRIAEEVGAAEYARGDGGQGAPLFLGGPDAVTFVRQAIGPGAGPRLEVVRIAEADTDAGAELDRAHASFTPGGVGGFRDATPLLRPPFRLEFAYAGPDGRWLSQWSGQAKLPRAVRVTVQSAAGVVLATAFPLKVTAAPEIAAQPPTPPQPTPGKAEPSQ
jgi:general secretion pathway protein J